MISEGIFSKIALLIFVVASSLLKPETSIPKIDIPFAIFLLFILKTVKTINIRSNIFYSGVSKKDNIFYTNGGRVMSIQTIGNSFNECSKKIYSDIQKISYSNKSFRSDIGKI